MSSIKLNSVNQKIVTEIIILFFVALFLYTGVSKIIDYDIAKEQFGLSPLLAPIAKEIIIILPTIEILTAIALFIPRTRKTGLYLSLILILSFTGYVIYILEYNDKLPCTCGGVLQQMSWPQHLIFNISCCILLLIVIVKSGLSKSAQNKISYSNAPKPTIQ
jgi:uncharacterized membrane protein YphA (DoxX/SURF4 family)